MLRSIVRFVLPIAFVAAPALAPAQAAGAQGAPAQTAPEVGQYAPDFTARWADARGERQGPVTLSENRGKVVVLAFYPKDRSSGCTAQLTKFRDEYATLFGGDVLLLPVSVDDLATHADWSKEMSFPFALVSDPNLELARMYGSAMEGRPMAARTVFVIGKDGKITWREMRFNALSEKAYADLAAAVKDALAK
ncbi:MAG TPA: peroxiredoxin family protein [Gemmatimonadaceae bacterium]|nr:peroxiredoxin family protein [Gemmatimonadaceae bacterium]